MPNNTDRPAAAEKAYMCEKDVANRLAISVKTLQKMRLAGGGIPFCKFGSAVRYKVSELAKYEAACVRDSTSDSGPCSDGDRF